MGLASVAHNSYAHYSNIPVKSTASDIDFFYVKMYSSVQQQPAQTLLLWTTAHNPAFVSRSAIEDVPLLAIG